MKTNKDLYSGSEFKYWSGRSGTINTENALFEKYLNKNLPTFEAGTGNGRISFYLESQGFTDLHACDYVHELIAIAKKRIGTSIRFDVQDICNTSYNSSQFYQIIYLTQILSFIDSSHQIKAVEESYRILKKSGVAIFSFNCLESRNDLGFKTFYFLIKIIRYLKRGKTQSNFLPWMKIAGKFNWKGLLDYPPYLCWFSISEILNLLESSGFKVIELGTKGHYEKKMQKKESVKLDRKYFSGPCYVICKK